MKQHPVDAVPAAPKLVLLSLQHLLAFYAGAVIVPLLIASSLNLDSATTIHLINADLFTCGLATLIQSVGVGRKVGVRLPIIQGVTTTAVAPIIAIGLAATNGAGGVASLPVIYGSIIVAGLFTFFAAPFFARLLRFFPFHVTGTVLLVMGTSLLAVSANDFVNYAQGVPSVRDLAYGFGTLATILLVQRFVRGFFGTISVLIGLVGGTVVALIAGHVAPEKLDAVATAPALGVTTPFYFGWPAFSFTAILSMLIVMLITMVETTGDVFATGEIVGKRITSADVAAAIRADGASTTLGGVLNSFPYTMFAQNVGLVRLTGIKSRWVAAGAGVLMIVVGLLPKVGAVVAAIPSPVLGGASLALFANVAWVGLQTIAKSDLADPRIAAIVTTALGLAMLVTFRPEIAQVFPQWAQVFFSSGMSIGAIAAIGLNLLFFHTGRRRRAEADVVARVSLDDVAAMDRETFVSTFRPLVNSQVWPLEKVWESRPFGSVAEFGQALQFAIMHSDSDSRYALLADYPNMYELLTNPDAVTGDIGSLALGSATKGELAELEALCAKYQEKFGVPYVAYLRTDDSMPGILAAARRRLENWPEVENMMALAEIGKITQDRLEILVRGAKDRASEFQS
ncbi:xanthine permease [Arcanobacterium wilhelmae]|uniref:Xanthine permease n=1 Tax=Arcanobacterium wilhelmae TaxID=1803177 RepID=A0ABT9NBV2_9ACTO|nr:solute carrier family 23 protein [Arcanobacterium wilhelmae]MDP9801188.1 xanthine permease [Arcanobacterium wilhelmae]WFN90540.1 solute carrier family 23 protein [Arcanobacterium wilhelmae]